MSGRIMQLNFKFSVTGAEYEQAVVPLAEQFAAQVTGHPALSEFSVKKFDVMEKVTAITRSPL